MTPTNRFGIITGFPEEGERAYINNVNINDVITYKVKGQRVFSVVLGTTTTMIKVVDLICEYTNNGVILYINSQQNVTTKCSLKPTRRLFKIRNVTRL